MTSGWNSISIYAGPRAWENKEYLSYKDAGPKGL